MNIDPVTLYFLTWQGVHTLLAGVLALIVVALVWLMLFGAERAQPVTFESWFKAAALGLFPVWVWLLGATLWGVWQVFNGVEGAPLASGSLGLGALIAAFLGAPFVIYGTYLRHKTQRLEQEGHMTDRINKAVEQLGSEKTEKQYSLDADGKPVQVERTVPNIEVRMGAILSLERIAQDSTMHDKGRDHVRVMEILCAYIRENARGSEAKKSLRVLYEEEREDPEMPEEHFDEWFCEQYNVHPLYLEDNISVAATKRWAANLSKPRADVQLALTVIGRRNEDQRRVEAAWPNPPTQAKFWPFDLDFKRLPDDPSDPPLGKAAKMAFKEGLEEWKTKLRDYRGYRLDLRGANLQGADMAAKQPNGSDAVFSGARFDGTRLEGASLWGARIEGANLFEARMEGADLSEARMEGAVLMEARIEGADLSLARMEGADLSEARMEGADLLHLRMESAYLWAAQMEGTNLSQTRMDSFTVLNSASFRGAALRKLDFTTVPMFEKQIMSCFGDASVILPNGTHSPDHWPDWELPDHGSHNYDKEWRKWQANPDTYRPPPKPE
ncbi:pentapeptide repeat protein [Roseinatronobacter thiooxidans]|uniref:Pentapeptide repeat protein n=2 Tax=Roseinatronobacter thiooxidans TaxID=121821 RepID=A0A2W7QDT3_9RHOB|nr:pentapeptide repeat protein [Roseinatronobacter thiooxidans]